MGRVRILFAAVLAAATLAVLAGPASSSTPAASSRYCKALNGISDKLSKSSGTSLSEGRAALRKYASALKSAAKNAPKKVRNATKTLASFYDALASGNANALKNTKNLGTAGVTISTYLATNCR